MPRDALQQKRQQRRARSRVRRPPIQRVKCRRVLRAEVRRRLHLHEQHLRRRVRLSGSVERISLQILRGPSRRASRAARRSRRSRSRTTSKFAAQQPVEPVAADPADVSPLTPAFTTSNGRCRRVDLPLDQLRIRAVGIEPEPGGETRADEQHRARHRPPRQRCDVARVAESGRTRRASFRHRSGDATLSSRSRALARAASASAREWRSATSSSAANQRHHSSCSLLVTSPRNIAAASTSSPCSATSPSRIPQGAFVAIVGPSGSGKTTLLGLLAGLDTPTQRHRCSSTTPTSRRWTRTSARELRGEKVGFVFQSFQLISDAHRARERAGAARAARRDAAPTSARASCCDASASATGSHHFPTQLSGGEQQRVAIARAFANSPRILFADEPTGNLDSDTGARIVELLEALNRESDTTIVLVTHDLALAARAQRIIRLERRPRRLATPRRSGSMTDAARSVAAAAGRQLVGLAWRESRTARRRLLLYMSSISLGVAALVAIDSFAEQRHPSRCASSRARCSAATSRSTSRRAVHAERSTRCSTRCARTALPSATVDELRVDGARAAHGRHAARAGARRQRRAIRSTARSSTTPARRVGAAAERAATSSSIRRCSSRSTRSVGDTLTLGIGDVRHHRNARERAGRRRHQRGDRAARLHPRAVRRRDAAARLRQPRRLRDAVQAPPNVDDQTQFIARLRKRDRPASAARVRTAQAQRSQSHAGDRSAPRLPRRRRARRAPARRHRRRERRARVRHAEDRHRRRSCAASARRAGRCSRSTSCRRR